MGMQTPTRSRSPLPITNPLNTNPDGSTAPPSPAFAKQASGSFHLRPDHTIIPSTTPTITPPGSPTRGSGTTPSGSLPRSPVFSSQYGGYGSQSYGQGGGGTNDAAAALLGPASSADDKYRKKRGADSPLAQVILYGGVTLVICGLLALWIRPSYMPSQTTRLSSHLTPYLPSSFVKLLKSTDESPAAPHPILPLITEANQKWETIITSQSMTFDKATRTYRNRYGLNPPPGFDKWFAFAIQGRNHSLVDEYNTLMADLKPFRSLSPQELRRRTAELAQVPGISIVSIRNGVAQVHSKSGKWAPALAFQQMLGAFVRDLPDMDIAINEKPEGRILPRQQRTIMMLDYGLEGEEEKQLNMSDPMITPSLKGFTAEWKRDGSTWESFRRSCPTESSARRLVESVRSAETSVGPVTFGVQGRASNKPDSASSSRRRVTGPAFPPARELTFSNALDANWDMCAKPSMHSLHSAFFSDQRSIEYLYPLFSPSKPLGFRDILIPSHHYWKPSSEFTYEWELKLGRTKEPTDLEWNAKNATIYWRGKVTRGADTPPGHGASFQKQRLVKMANQLPFSSKLHPNANSFERVLVTFDEKTASLSSRAVPFSQLSGLLSDIAMACDPNLGECAYLRSLGYRVEPPAPLSDAWHHKYVLDLDEIGFSPRFFALMESKSAVVKSSVQQEFWKGWAIPWKHFIPVSSSYSELYNIQAFFSGLPAGLNSTNLTVTQLTRPDPIPDLPALSDGTSFTNDGALKDIAEAGSHWRNTHVRKADMECYVYRLMIEWAALTSIVPGPP